MKTGRFSGAQIILILKQVETCVRVPNICREDGMSSASFYKWRTKYGGMDASMVSQMKTMESENRRLKRMYAEMSMQNNLLKEALGKSGKAISKARDGRECREEQADQHRAGVPHL